MLTGEGITFQRGVTVTKVEVRDGQKVVHYKDSGTGRGRPRSAAEILCAEGRLANVEGLNLEAVGVHADPQHGIEVDDLLQTHAVRVFAIGDVLLRNQYTHAAEREAEVAFQNAVLRRRRKMDYTHLPWATFLDPEVATVGLSEDRAKAEEIDHRVYKVAYENVDRARIDGRTEGFAKVVATPSGKILGATILGEEASLVLQQLVVAMDRRPRPPRPRRHHPDLPDLRPGDPRPGRRSTGPPEASGASSRPPSISSTGSSRRLPARLKPRTAMTDDDDRHAEPAATRARALRRRRRASEGSGETLARSTRPSSGLTATLLPRLRPGEGQNSRPVGPTGTWPCEVIPGHARRGCPSGRMRVDAWNCTRLEPRLPGML